MRKIFKAFLMTFLVLSSVCYTGCEKEKNENGNNSNNGNGNEPQTVVLAGTAWVGKYTDTYQGYPAKLTWSLDFTDETSGEFFFELVVAGQEQANQSIPFTYTFDGREGTMNAGEMGTSNFTYDSITNTISMNLMVEVSNDGSTLGGVTTFYLRGQEPPDDDDPTTDTIDDGVVPGEITDQFPANTHWNASQNTVYHTDELGDLPMTLDYLLTFNNNHIATINVTATVWGQTSDPKTVRFNWTFDNASNTGTLTTKGVPMSYSFNPDDNTIVTDFSFDPNGSGTSGGTTVFRRVEDKGLIVRL